MLGKGLLSCMQEAPPPCVALSVSHPPLRELQRFSKQPYELLGDTVRGISKSLVS